MEGHVDITAPAVVALIALLFGIAMERLRQPAIVGYIIAGVFLGPSALGLVTDTHNLNALAEFGVLMLLFVLGMELNVKRFIANWRVATVTTGAQVGFSVGVMLLLRYVFNWSLGLSILLGFVVALSSTAVVIKILDATEERETEAGRLSLGVLIAQDMAVAPMLLIIGAFSGAEASALDLVKIVLSVALMVGTLWVLTHRQVTLPFGRMLAGHHDLGPLSSLTFCFGAAALAGLIGLSAAYGAFLAGLILGNTAHRRELLQVTEPIQAVLLMLFFLSVGLLLDLGFIWDNLWTVLLLLLLVTVFKTMLNIGVLHFQKVPWTTAFITGIGLAQIGEFSFLLASHGESVGLMTPTERQLVVAVTVMSLALSPIWVKTNRRLGDMASQRLASLGEVLEAAYGHEADLFRHICTRMPRLGKALNLKACQVVLRRDTPIRFKPAKPDLMQNVTVEEELCDVETKSHVKTNGEKNSEKNDA